MRALTIACITLTCACALPAWAVNKCKDGSGKITYQEHPCATPEAGGKIKLAPALDGHGDDASADAKLARIRGDNAKFDAMISGKVMRGMSATQVQSAWGYPTKVNTSSGSYGTHEQWVYRRGGGAAQYVYLENGVVTTIQSND